MVDVGFEPGRVRLARELKGWSQAKLAERLGVTAQAVSQFEAGTTKPSGETVDRMAEVLGVPVGFFALELVETHEGFFRSLRRTSVAHRRRARALAQIAHDRADLDAAQLPRVSLPTPHPVALDADVVEIEAAAEAVRREWRVPSGPIADVVALLEDHGIIVIRMPMDTADVDAFSLPFADRPVVVLCTDKDDRARSRFDAAHELGHLVLHGDQVWGMNEVEKQAHSFAAAFLMPRKDIYDELPSKADWLTFFELKQRWDVSIAALLMRSRDLGKMTPAAYMSAMKLMSAKGWRRREPVSLGAPEQPRLLEKALSDRASQRVAKVVLPEATLDTLLGATRN